MSQLALLPGLARREVGLTGDELGRFFTPDDLALLCCGALAEIAPLPRLVLDGSVGGGAFPRAVRRVAPRVHVTGIDIDEQAEGRRYVDEHHVDDFTTRDIEPMTYDWTVGNPPFTGMTALPHILQARRVTRHAVGLILPWSYIGGVDCWSPLFFREHKPMLVCPITPRPWGDSVREVAFYMWVRGYTGRIQVGNPLVWA